MFLFYNSNKDILIETQTNLLTNSNSYLNKLIEYVNNQLNNISNYLMNYFFSKNTQMLLKFAYNMSRNKFINTYKYYKNKFINLFNPSLLLKTSRDNVYYIPFLLNGETHRVPIVVPQFSYEKKQPPLMVLNSNEDDITQKILKFIGPNNDFYNMSLKPCHLGEKTLNFMMEDGSEINVDENDTIVL